MAEQKTPEQVEGALKELSTKGDLFVAEYNKKIPTATFLAISLAVIASTAQAAVVLLAWANIMLWCIALSPLVPILWVLTALKAVDLLRLRSERDSIVLVQDGIRAASALMEACSQATSSAVSPRPTGGEGDRTSWN
jgi:hypothetical protein